MEGRRFEKDGFKNFKKPTMSMNLNRDTNTINHNNGRGYAKAPSSNGNESVIVSNKRQRQDSSTRSDTEVCPIQVIIRCRGRHDYEPLDTREPGIMVNKDLLDELRYKTRTGDNATWETYQFDRVFNSTTPQRTLYDETVSPILAQVLEGYNCTIFAYGQTGTGKTHTMEGDLNDVPLIPAGNSGIIPRVLHYLFESLNLESKEVMTVVKLSMVEIYNEEVYDLLVPPHQFAGVGISNQSSLDLPKLTLNLDVNQNLVVKGLKEHIVLNKEEGVNYLSLGSSRRHTASTKLNKISSRSHSIFTLTIYSNRTTSNGEKVTKVGKLNLVDLAGSEDIGRSGAQHSHAAEAGKINQSLLTLGKIIKRLYDNSINPPGIKPTYRESKLTRILEDSLGGGTKTCIIATVSLAEADLKESISTLKYASQAKAIKTRPKVNISLGDAALYKDYRDENERLKQELKLARTREGVYLSNEQYSKLQSETNRLTQKVEELGFYKNKLETDNKDLTELQIRQSRQLLELQKLVQSTNEKYEAKAIELEETQQLLSNTTKQLDETVKLKDAYKHSESNLDQIAQKLLDDLEFERKRSDIFNQVLQVKQQAVETNDQASQVLVKNIGQESARLQDHLSQILNTQVKWRYGIQESLNQLVNELHKFSNQMQLNLQDKTKLFKLDIVGLETETKSYVNQSATAYNELETGWDGLLQSLQPKFRALQDALNCYLSSTNKTLDNFQQKWLERSKALELYVQTYLHEAQQKVRDRIDGLQLRIEEKEKELEVEKKDLTFKREEMYLQLAESQEHQQSLKEKLISTIVDQLQTFTEKTDRLVKDQFEKRKLGLDLHDQAVTTSCKQFMDLAIESKLCHQESLEFSKDAVQHLHTNLNESNQQLTEFYGTVEQQLQNHQLNVTEYLQDVETNATDQILQSNKLVNLLRSQDLHLQQNVITTTNSATNHINTLESVQKDNLKNMNTRYQHHSERLVNQMDTWTGQELKPSLDRIGYFNNEQLDLVKAFVNLSTNKDLDNNLPKLLPPRNTPGSTSELRWDTVDPETLTVNGFNLNGQTGVKRLSQTPKINPRKSNSLSEADKKVNLTKRVSNPTKSVKSEK